MEVFNCHSVHRLPRRDRSGFTLIELLVVISILILLATMTLTLVNFTLDGERVRGGVRQIQSFVEGARDRAILAREPRGVRFMPSDVNGRTCTTMVYIAPTEPWNQGTIQLERDKSLPTTSPLYNSVRIVRGLDTDWGSLISQELLVPGARIKIPGDRNGTWYNIASGAAVPGNSREYLLTLAIPYLDPGTSESNETVAFVGGGPSTYLLELPPAILPGAEGKPTALPRGVVIDLDGSQIPLAWRPSTPAPPPYVPVATDYVYSPHMDIMFTPRGTVIGPPAAAGLIHLVVCDGADVDLQAAAYLELLNHSNSNKGGVDQFISGSPERPRVFPDTFTYQDEVLGERILVTLATQTGKISSHELYSGSDVLDPYDLDGDNNYLNLTDLRTTPSTTVQPVKRRENE